MFVFAEKLTFLRSHPLLKKYTFCGFAFFSCCTLSACPSHLPLQNQLQTHSQNQPKSQPSIVADSSAQPQTKMIHQPSISGQPPAETLSADQHSAVSSVRLDHAKISRLRLGLSQPFLNKIGDTAQITVTAIDLQGQEIPEAVNVQWSSSAAHVFEVDQKGLVTARQATGTAEIFAEIPGTDLKAQLKIEMMNSQGLCGDSCKGGGGGNARRDRDPAQISEWLPWSEASTWQQLGRSKPVAGETVTIPAGQRIELDESTPDLAGLYIDGELRLAQGRTLELQADYIMVHGAFLAGSAQNPYTGQATITLNAQNSTESIHSMGTRGIFSMGGRLQLFGQAPSSIWTKLNQHANAGANSVNVISAQDWKAGDHIIIAPTDYYGISETESLQLQSVSGPNLTLTSGLHDFHWGQLQYLGANGMSLSPTGHNALNPGTPTILDERASVGNLSRNIVIQGADDALWQNQGFGAQVMVMGNQSQTHLNGLEFRRVGQAGRMGRYPIHFHLLSYENGLELPFAGQREIRNNAVWDSSNRCITIHGTNDTIVDHNICYEIDGHAIFLEDAVERRNQITNNLVLKVRQPSQPLLDSDRAQFQRGPSGFWLTNPDNTVTGNLAADALGNGYWLAFPTSPLGLSQAVNLRPNRLPFGQFANNTTHSNGRVGIQLDWVPFNSAGETRPQSYAPSSDGGNAGPYDNWVRFGMSDITTFKNLDSGFWNRTTWPDYERWVSADNLGVFFAGAGSDGNIRHSLLVAQSLNNTHTWQNLNPDLQQRSSNPAPVGFASYHSTFNLAQNTLVNFAFVSGESSGAFKTNDYYITAVDKGLVRNPNNELINSHPGYRTPVQTQENWTLAGALWDPHGYWGPAGNYWVYDNSFLTSGAQCQSVSPSGENGMSCDAEYYGVGGFVVDGSERYMPQMPILATRYADDGSVLGEWSVGPGAQAPMLSNMRHFAAMRNGRYFLDFPGESIPTQQVEMDITNAYRNEDTFILGVRFSGQITPNVYVQSPYHLQNLSAADSLAEVEASDGEAFWQDIEHNIVWLRVRQPGVYPAANMGEEYTDWNLYQSFRLHIEAS